MKYKATPDNSDMKPLTREEVRKFSGAYGKRALLSVPKVLALLDERDELLADHNAALAEVERLKAHIWNTGIDDLEARLSLAEGRRDEAQTEVERLRDLLEARTEVCIDLLATAARLREALHEAGCSTTSALAALTDSEPVAKWLAEHDAKVREEARGSIPPTAPTEPTCATCGKPATCIGRYEGMTEDDPACDDCCGHGNEDGRCEPITCTSNRSTAPTAVVLPIGGRR